MTYDPFHRDNYRLLYVNLSKLKALNEAFSHGNIIDGDVCNNLRKELLDIILRIRKSVNLMDDSAFSEFAKKVEIPDALQLLESSGVQVLNSSFLLVDFGMKITQFYDNFIPDARFNAKEARKNFSEIETVLKSIDPKWFNEILNEIKTYIDQFERDGINTIRQKQQDEMTSTSIRLKDAISTFYAKSITSTDDTLPNYIWVNLGSLMGTFFDCVSVFEAKSMSIDDVKTHFTDLRSVLKRVKKFYSQNGNDDKVEEINHIISKSLEIFSKPIDDSEESFHSIQKELMELKESLGDLISP